MTHSWLRRGRRLDGDSLRLLLQNGGKVVAWNKYGKTPLDYAEMRLPEIVALLRDYCTPHIGKSATKWRIGASIPVPPAC